MEERRSSDRQLSCIPASFESKDDREDLALIRDVSDKGARIYTRTELAIGERVTLHLYLGGHSSASRAASGRVVRVDRREPPRSDVWRWELGVEFDAPITDLEPEIEELSRQQEAAGVLKR
jgi:hypothetical protein